MHDFIVRAPKQYTEMTATFLNTGNGHIDIVAGGLTILFFLINYPKNEQVAEKLYSTHCKPPLRRHNSKRNSNICKSYRQDLSCRFFSLIDKAILLNCSVYDLGVLLLGDHRRGDLFHQIIADGKIFGELLAGFFDLT